MRIPALLRLAALLLVAGLADAPRRRGDGDDRRRARHRQQRRHRLRTFATADGPVAGIEQIATTVITTGAGGAVVGRLERQVCAGGAFGAPLVYDAGGWSVGLGNGTGGSAVVETYIPLSMLPSGRRDARAGDLGQRRRRPGRDGRRSHRARARRRSGAVVAIPLSPWLLPPLALLLFALTAWLRRRHPGRRAAWRRGRRARRVRTRLGRDGAPRRQRRRLGRRRRRRWPTRPATRRSTPISSPCSSSRTRRPSTCAWMPTSAGTRWAPTRRRRWTPARTRRSRCRRRRRSRARASRRRPAQSAGRAPDDLEPGLRPGSGVVFGDATALATRPRRSRLPAPTCCA